MIMTATATARQRVKPTPIKRERVRDIPPTKAEQINRAANRNSLGHFGQGNKIWRFVSPGCPRIFKSPEELWTRACAYFEWQSDNPFKEQRIASERGEPVHVQVDKLVPFTLDALQLYLNITDACWYDYANNRSEFASVCGQIMKVIRSQKFNGAAAGFFNHAIIARDLGLADKKEITGADNAPLIPPEQGDNRAKNMRALMLAALAVGEETDGDESGA